MRISCCYRCPDRAEGCHGRCERYQAARAVIDEQHRIQRIRQDAESYFSDRTANIMDYKRPGSKKTHLKGAPRKK